jgi:predicted DsbA family dithiol-disulfide isomerase
MVLLGFGAGALQAAPAQSTAGGPDAVGLIGADRLTESSIVQADQAAFDRLRSDYETEQHQLESKYAHARYALLKRQLDDRLDAAALKSEAKARGVTTETVLADLKTSPPTQEEMHAFYEQNKDRIRAPYEEIAPKAREYLAAQRTEAAKRTFYDALRAKHGIKSLLGPYRVAVAATGPARGPGSAAVTIVEFGDFQCPYCKRVESSLHAVLEQYPHEVRIVFRQLPLAQIHPYAEGAAEAAVCADRQGKFWEMHDAMYADQSALTPDALKETAKRLGLDLDRFSACLSEGAPAAALDADLKAAQDLGLSGTPYFFINGRPVDGNVPLEQFQSIIAEELRAGASDRG